VSQGKSAFIEFDSETRKALSFHLTGVYNEAAMYCWYCGEQVCEVDCASMKRRQQRALDEIEWCNSVHPIDVNRALRWARSIEKLPGAYFMGEKNPNAAKGELLALCDHVRHLCKMAKARERLERI
jgi:hypothetical protein